MVQVEAHFTLQPDGVAQVDPGREDHRAAASGSSRVNCTIDGGRVNVRSVALCPELAYVESCDALARELLACATSGIQRSGRSRCRCRGKSSARHLQQISALHDFLPQSSMPPADYGGLFAGENPARPLCHMGLPSCLPIDRCRI